MAQDLQDRMDRAACVDRPLIRARTNTRSSSASACSGAGTCSSGSACTAHSPTGTCSGTVTVICCETTISPVVDRLKQ